MDIMKVIIRFTSADLRMIMSSIKEICKKIDLFEFRTRIGANQSDAIIFNDKMAGFANSMNCNYIDIEVSIEEMRIINNALNEVCNGIRVLHFEEKMGYSRDIVQSLLDRINPVLTDVDLMGKSDEVSGHNRMARK